MTKDRSSDKHGSGASYHHTRQRTTRCGNESPEPVTTTNRNVTITELEDDMIADDVSDEKLYITWKNEWVWNPTART